MAVFDTPNLHNLISRKIREAEKLFNFHTVSKLHYEKDDLFVKKLISRNFLKASYNFTIIFRFQDLTYTTVRLTLIILILTRIECIITIKQFICLEGMWTFNT